MSKYSKKILEDISKLIETDSFTIAEICDQTGISERSFYAWQAKYAEFAEVIKKARLRFDEMCIAEAKRSLMKMVKGYEVEEIKSIVVDSGKKNDKGKQIPKLKEQVKTVKHIQPSLGAIIFTLTNKDPENWKNRQESVLSGDIGVSKGRFDNMTDEELQKYIHENKWG